MEVETSTAPALRAAVYPLDGRADDYDPLLQLIDDARATAMGEAGEWNVGQLSRELFGGESVLVGFSTYHGTVTAASDWDAPAERRRVRPGLPGSWESLFHGLDIPAFLLPFKGANHCPRSWAAPGWSAPSG